MTTQVPKMMALLCEDDWQLAKKLVAKEPGKYYVQSFGGSSYLVKKN